MQVAELLVIEVRDTGIGMTEEQLGHVFEEFQQADNTTTRKYGGTGLGLPISRHLAQLLGGDLIAASVEGEGSTFTLDAAAALWSAGKRTAAGKMPAVRVGRMPAIRMLTRHSPPATRRSF